jgi:hypothetical protein
MTVAEEPEPHPFDPDLFGGCQRCREPETNRDMHPLPEPPPSPGSEYEPEPVPALYPTDSTQPLNEIRDFLIDNVEEGVHCPACTQMAKVYRNRKVSGTMAKTLITLWRHAGMDYAHGPSLPGDTHEISQLAWWGLVEEERVLREDGGRAGWWRLTEHGRAFVLARATIPKYARVYDSRFLNLRGKPVTIRDALGSKFDYRELMEGL